MSMIKYVSPAGWDFDRPVAMPIKISSRGLIGEDLREFVKVAGSNIFLPELDRIKFAKDEYPLHCIALGASEAYGPNRNGDGFDEATCQRQHPTFVKFARFYRNHKNKPDQGHPWFGLIKASAYNPVMRRVELLIALNMEKSACERNGGLVADVELEKLAKDGDLPLSMACRVPYDVCSWCHNQAKTRKEYCGQEKCAAGGCASNLTRLVKVAGDMHHLHVNNPNSVWFDMSRVFRPADRIAWGAKADWLTKAAADGGVFDLTDLWKMAEDATAPVEVILYQDGLPGHWTTKIAAQVKLAYGLAAIDELEGQRNAEFYRPFATSAQSAFPVETLGKAGTEKSAAALGALADQKIILPLRDFARWVGSEDNTKAAAERLPGVYQRMIDDESLERRVEANRFPLAEKLAASRQRAVASLVSAEFSLEKEAVEHRGMLSALRGKSLPAVKTFLEKGASDNVGAEQLARDYAIYKVAALERIAAFDPVFTLTARYSIRQNHVL